MQTVPNIKIARAPIVMKIDGKKWYMETTHMTLNRWLTTPFGQVNFGFVWMSAPRWIECE
jgi:hypothetical protein